MPTSEHQFDTRLRHLLANLDTGQPVRLLDIGAGTGKVGKLARAAITHSPLHLTAIEIDTAYIEKYHLRETYDVVIADDAAKLPRAGGLMLRERWDLAVIGDCLEHLTKSDGVNLLHYLRYHARWIVAIIPIAYPQFGTPAHPQEAHISLWDESDFASGHLTASTSRKDYMLFVILPGLDAGQALSR